MHNKNDNIKNAKKKKEVEIMSLAAGHIHSEARGGRGDEEDEERGSCRTQWVNNNRTVSQHYYTL